MNEKRFHERRISFHSATIFPFQDYSGTLIESDRRRMPDRRLNNIWLELVTLKPGEMLDGWNHTVHRNFS